MSYALVLGTYYGSQAQMESSFGEGFNALPEKTQKIVGAILLNASTFTLTLAAIGLVPILATCPALTFTVVKTCIEMLGEGKDPISFLISKGVDLSVAKALVEFIKNSTK